MPYYYYLNQKAIARETVQESMDKLPIITYFGIGKFGPIEIS